MSLKSQNVQPCETKKNDRIVKKDETSDNNFISNMKSVLSPQMIGNKAAGYLYTGMVSMIIIIRKKIHLVYKIINDGIK